MVGVGSACTSARPPVSVTAVDCIEEFTDFYTSELTIRFSRRVYDSYVGVYRRSRLLAFEQVDGVRRVFTNIRAQGVRVRR